MPLVGHIDEQFEEAGTRRVGSYAAPRESRRWHLRVLLACASVGVLFSLAACSGDESTPPAVQQSGTSESSHDPAGSPSPVPPTTSPSEVTAAEVGPATALREALQALIAADTGTITRSATAITSTSDYRLSTGSVRLNSSATGDDADSFAVATSGGQAFFQLATWEVPLRKCWLQLTTNQLEPFTGVVADPDLGTLPLEIAVLDDARASGRDDEDELELHGSFVLASALPLFGVDVQSTLGEMAIGRARVVATFQLTSEGALGGYSIEGRDIRALLRENDLLDGLSAEQSVGLAYVRTAVTIDGLGTRTRGLRVPTPPLRMTESELATGAGCAAVR